MTTSLDTPKKTTADPPFSPLSRQRCQRSLYCQLQMSETVQSSAEGRSIGRGRVVERRSSRKRRVGPVPWDLAWEWGQWERKRRK